jgi:LPXTG-motif cell wall-anchored protein
MLNYLFAAITIAVGAGFVIVRRKRKGDVAAR